MTAALHTGPRLWVDNSEPSSETTASSPAGSLLGNQSIAMPRRRRMPSLTSLRAFEAVARNLSFTQAADELCVTQGAISHQIKVLEETLGTSLFLRGPAGIELTEDSEDLLATTFEAFNNIEAATDDIARRAGAHSVRLSVQSAPVFANHWLIPRLHNFHSKHPNIEICINTNPNIKSSMTHDFIIDSTIEPANNASDFKSIDPLMSTPCVALCSPSLMEKAIMGGNALRDSALLCYQGADYWPLIAEAGESSARLPSKRIFFDNPLSVVNAGIFGQGLMLGSPLVLKELMRLKALVAPFKGDYGHDETYVLRMRRPNHRNRAATAFRSWVLAEAAASVTIN